MRAALGNQDHPLRIFAGSGVVSIVAIAVAFFYGGLSAAVLTAILGVMEVSLSFDNAVVNAGVLERMSPFWQRMFLLVGVPIAVFGMRLLLPLLVVYLTAGLSFGDAINLALEKRPIDDPTSYAALLQHAHPAIAAFGGCFLLLLFLNWVFDQEPEREVDWLVWLERPLRKAGKLDAVAIMVTLVALVVFAYTLAPDAKTVLFAGLLGVISYLAVNGLGTYFEGTQEHVTAGDVKKAVGKAAFFLFMYLEVLDASFSFDGVIGAFAITSDPILIALGLGLIGALFVRSLTIFLVRKGTLSEYVYLEHGAHWSIGILAVILLVSMGVHIPEVFTGLIGAALIIASFIHSLVRLKRRRALGLDDESDEPEAEPVSSVQLVPSSPEAAAARSAGLPGWDPRASRTDLSSAGFGKHALGHPDE